MASTLGSGDKRVVVLIDDADRLAPDRLAELLRLLASAAPIANLVFVMSLSRDLVDGEVIDKIVQLAIDLPLADRPSLQQMFVDRLEPVLNGAREGGLVDPDYWVDICAHAIDPFLRTPRDVVRLVNAVTATLPAVSGEVNPVDFIGAGDAAAVLPRRLRSGAAAAVTAFLLPTERAARRDGVAGDDQAYHERWRERLSGRPTSRAPRTC